jgi:hypothetical protein
MCWLYFFYAIMPSSHYGTHLVFVVIMKTIIKSLLISLPLLVTTNSYADNGWRFKTQFMSYSVSEIVSIKSLVDDTWHGDYQSGTTIFTTNRADISISKGHWLFGLSTRFDYFGSFSKDTGRLFYLDKNNIDQPDNQYLNIYLGVEHAASHGVFIEYNNAFKNVEYAVRLNYWKSETVLSGVIDGVIQTTTNKNYKGQLAFDYNYDEDPLFDRLNNVPVEATGYSIDIDVFWHINDVFDVSLKLKDISHRLEWDNVNYTKATLDRTQGKDSGMGSFKGVENNVDYVQRFNQQSYLQVGYKTDYGRVYGGSDYIINNHYAYVGFEREFFNDGLIVSFAFYPSTSSIKLGVNNDNFGLNLGINKTTLSKSNTLMLGMYLKY